MLQCLSINSPPSDFEPPLGHLGSQPPPSRGASKDGTPRSSGFSSPVDLQLEYAQALQCNSYNEMWTRIQGFGSGYYEQELSVHPQEYVEVIRERVQTLVLQPNRECVMVALENAKPCKLKRLVSDYFDASETTSNTFILLRRDVRRAQAVYGPLLELLSVLPADVESLTEPQCRRVHEILLQFARDCHENPLLCLEAGSFKPMQDCFFKLKEHLDHRSSRSKSRANLIRRATSGPGVCLIGTAAVVAIAVAAVTAHFILAAVATPCVVGSVGPKKFAEKETVRADKLKAASRVTLIVDEYLKSICSLVDRLQTVIEADKRLIQIGLERDGDMYPVKLVVKHLRQNPSDFLQLLEHLEVQICLCFTTINKARRLLQDICCPSTDASENHS